jgi:hypothetical protein
MMGSNVCTGDPVTSVAFRDGPLCGDDRGNEKQP